MGPMKWPWHLHATLHAVACHQGYNHVTGLLLGTPCTGKTCMSVSPGAFYSSFSEPYIPLILLILSATIVQQCQPSLHLNTLCCFRWWEPRDVWEASLLYQPGWQDDGSCQGRGSISSWLQLCPFVVLISEGGEGVEPMRLMSACPGLVIETYNPRYWEAEAGGS